MQELDFALTAIAILAYQGQESFERKREESIGKEGEGDGAT